MSKPAFFFTSLASPIISSTFTLPLYMSFLLCHAEIVDSFQLLYHPFSGLHGSAVWWIDYRPGGYRFCLVLPGWSQAKLLFFFFPLLRNVSMSIDFIVLLFKEMVKC